LVDGGAFEVAPGLEVEEEIKNLVAFEGGKMQVWIVVGEAANPVEVSFNGTIAEAFELDKA